MESNSTMAITRRTFVSCASAGSAILAAPGIISRAQAASPIKVGCLLDLTGTLGVYGQPMFDATQLALKEINDKGGLLGRPVSLVSYDTQSNIALYSQYAQRLALSDHVDVVQAGITSASREAIRPVFHRAKILYFYNQVYEGGVCDKNCFCVGTTPAMTIAKLMPWAIQKWGKKVYVIAADYNFGHISASWVDRFAKENGGTVVASEFFPLEVSEFSSTISKIQAAKPDLVLSVLVGSNHNGFYRQWASSGMSGRIPIGSTTFGLSNELATMSAAETNGIVSSFGFFPDLPIAKATWFTETMLKEYHAAANELSADQYDGMMLWAKGVQKAGTLDRAKVIAALETGVSTDGPCGTVSIDPTTHHTVRSTYLAQAKDRQWDILASFPDQHPKDTGGACNLIKNPETNKEFVI
jgi:branched-chain amino acid transport system substrate-binding protein